MQITSRREEKQTEKKKGRVIHKKINLDLFMCNSPVHSYKWETKQIVKNFTKKPDRIHASGRIRSLPSVVSSQGRPLLCCSAIHSGYSFFHLSWQNCCSVESYS